MCEINNQPKTKEDIQPAENSISYSVTEYKSHSCSDCESHQLASSALLEICMIISGAGVHRVLNQDIPCKDGDIFLTPPNTPHGYFPQEGEVMMARSITFDVAEWFSGEAAHIGKLGYCYGVFNENPAVACAMLNESMRDNIRSLFDSIEREIANKQKAWEAAVRAYLSVLFITVGRYINCAIKNISSDSLKDWDTVLSVIKIIKSSYSDPELTLESIAEQLYISKSHLSRVFKNLTGEKFSDYLKTVRLGHSCLLLRKSNMTVEAIVKDRASRTPSR